MNNKVVIRFMAEVNQQSTHSLINTVEAQLAGGAKKIKILISSLGGSVFHGISAYNFLKGIPAEVETHNFGSVDSIATVIFCAGTKRYCVPNARFLIHSVGWGSQSPVRFEEKQINELLNGLKIDRENIAKIVAENCKKTQKQIEDVMFEGTTLSPQEAKDFGLVHEVSKILTDQTTQIVGIG